ncbi:MAG: CoA-binding protein [bacterium]|nr:CoA-binding protein [bacterium]
MNLKLFPSDTSVLIQGMTGKEGQRMAQWLIGSGVRVVAGVTPGKGGQEVGGRPIFNTVAEARETISNIYVSCVVVPPSRVLEAVMSALEAGITIVNILTEQVPVYDVIRMREKARECGAIILGPSSVGYLQFPRFRIGYLGGEHPFDQLKEGSLAVLSTSGGMTNEIIMALARHGMGIRFAMALGGDRIIGYTLEDAILFAESEPSVKAVALFMEPGRAILSRLLDGSFVFQKPTVLFLAGAVLDRLPRGIPYGHAGTILNEDDRSVSEVRKGLREKGIRCASTMSEFLELCRNI